MSDQIIYVVKSANLCGGVRVIFEHVVGLVERGHDAKIYYVHDDTNWFRTKIPAQHFNSTEELCTALKAQTGIKVATWFETAWWVSENLNAGDRGYYLVQDIEDSYCITEESKEWALSSYKLGLKPLATSKWVYKQLTERFYLPSTFVSLGVNFDSFFPIVPAPKKDRYRILTQCRVWSAGPNLKDWPTAKATAESVFEKDRNVSLVTYSMESKQVCRPDMPHIHIQGPSDVWLNEIYNTSGVYLLTSKHEGFSLTAAEALATGTPIVATYAQGNEEYCFNGKTALMAEAGDVETLTKHVLTIFHNPDYADSLAQQGQDFIKQYEWKRSIDALEFEFFGTGKPISIEESTKPTIALFGKNSNSIEYPEMKGIAFIRGNPVASIVIPTVDDANKTGACLEVIQKTPNGGKMQIIVVDDGTKDCLIQAKLSSIIRRETYRSGAAIELISNNQNLGFSASVNNGMRRAHGDYIVLCNNDTHPVNDWFDQMITAAELDPKIAIVGAKLLYPDNTIQHAGMDKGHNSLQFPHMSRYKDILDKEACTSKYVWAVTGALFLIKRKALFELGGFSTAYATAWEDVDYCLNAWIKGWKVYYCADATAYHYEGKTRGATFAEKKERPLMWMERERAGEAYFTKKWQAIRTVNSLEELQAIV